jgi:biopolymer transport protein ExbD
VQFKRGRELKRTRIEIIPMIDTIFFLLVFFMLSSLSLTQLNGLRVNLPRATTMPRQPSSQLTLTIDRTQKLFVNSQPATLNSLPAQLTKAAGKTHLEDVSLVVNADSQVPYGLIIKTIDASRTVGIQRFAMATAPASTTSVAQPAGRPSQ